MQSFFGNCSVEVNMLLSTLHFEGTFPLPTINHEFSFAHSFAFAGSPSGGHESNHGAWLVGISHALADALLHPRAELKYIF